MNTLMKNTYGKNTFFIAYIEKVNYVPDQDAKVSGVEYNAATMATSRQILRASEMAEDLTAESLIENFGVKKELIREIHVVQAYYIKQIAQHESHQKFIYTVESLVPEPTEPHKLVIILQGIAFDQFFTEAFHVKGMQEALRDLEVICNSAIVLNTIYTTVIKTINLHE